MELMMDLKMENMMVNELVLKLASLMEHLMLAKLMG